MRGAHRLIAGMCAALLLPACQYSAEEKTPDWQKPPASYDVKGADLTFNEKRLDEFNSMSSAEREAHVEQLKTTEGSFRGQAIFERGAELGEAMDDAQYGKYEINAAVPEAVLYEITLVYHLYSDQDFFTGVPPGTHIEFAGTLADLEFQDESKPRKMTLKVKATSVERLK
ncbi:hypothetical protein [Paraliomyxa miuraensis]|uniref:hypothetical protein n=1 Tax=Paraliomyxa miuraensis TaxID=376150 RepID=UPI00224D6173|nr:hypothetical protein [Paraliomyxa miuraensis]MCX4245878.1 hypothetical protein [Paraliomyxa miuraensis]